jgi:hypothetical protein
VGTLAETVDLALDGDMQAHAPNAVAEVAVAQRLKRWLTTRRGTMPWWPNRGTDLRQYLLSKTPTWRIMQDVEAELLKDEQVEAVATAVELLDSGRRLRLVVAVACSATRNFQFTMDITTAAGTLVALQARS